MLHLPEFQDFQRIVLDVHKKSIDVAISDARANGKIRSYGKIDGTLEALDKLVRKLKSPGSDLHFVYEAGPCDYPIYRHLTSKGHSCSAVAPSLVPRRSGDRIKTDRRDALNLVGLFRAGELTRIYVPTSEDEAMRDLLRCRVPFGFIVGIFSLLGASVVKVNEQPIYGLKGLVTAILLIGLFCLIFIIVEGIFLSIGLWLYSKFRPINIKYDCEHPLEADEVEAEVVKSEPLQMTDDNTT